MSTNKREMQRNKRKVTIRKKISGTSERPRMCLHKSNRNIYVQIIDDLEGKTLCGFSTKTSGAEGKKSVATCNNVDFAKKAGEEIAKLAKEKGVTTIVFDRSGYQYHGVVKALADSARENGLKF